MSAVVMRHFALLSSLLSLSSYSGAGGRGLLA